MKYGLISVPINGVNLGDAVQSFALKKLYEANGINEFTYINRGESYRYKGEKLVLIMNMWNRYDRYTPSYYFRESQDIDYKYIGYHLCGDVDGCLKNNMLSKDRVYGCRDIGTRDLFRKWGYQAYFSGCVSMTIPRREDGDYNKVYVFDADVRIASCISEPKDVIYLHVDNTNIGMHNWKDAEDEVETRLTALKHTAKAVITTKLHGYIPCVALGIPSTYVGVKEYRTELVNMFTKDTADELRRLVKANIEYHVFNKGTDVSDELDKLGDKLYKKDII